MGQMGIQVGEICQLNGSPGEDAAMRTWLKVRICKTHGNLAIAIKIILFDLVIPLLGIYSMNSHT